MARCGRTAGTALGPALGKPGGRDRECWIGRDSGVLEGKEKRYLMRGLHILEVSIEYVIDDDGYERN